MCLVKVFSSIKSINHPVLISLPDGNDYESQKIPKTKEQEQR